MMHIRSFIILTMFSVLPFSAQAKIKYFENNGRAASCSFKCNQGGSTSNCPAGWTVHAPGEDPYRCSSPTNWQCSDDDGPSTCDLTDCRGAATVICGAGNFMVYMPPHAPELLESAIISQDYTVESVTDSKGNTYEGQKAIEYLNQRFEKAPSRK